MFLVKICSREKFSNMNNQIKVVIEELLKKTFQVHVQELDNNKYQRWLANMSTMEWRTIIDVLWDETLVEYEAAIRFVCELLNVNSIDLNKLDIYVAEQMQYKEPVNNAEVITSCYFWNYKNSKETRILKMKEHFSMEKKQYYYDYVAFQSVIEVLTSHSLKFDFFFESHVSNPNGIDAIYSKPALEGMRKHSEAFLDVGTRKLTFGRVSCYGD